MSNVPPSFVLYVSKGPKCSLYLCYRQNFEESKFRSTSKFDSRLVSQFGSQLPFMVFEPLHSVPRVHMERISRLQEIL